MKINTAQFGELEISDTNIITFSKGIPGFEDYQKYVLLPADEKGESPFFFLQSIEHAEISFFLLDTFSFFKEYDIKLDDEILEKLEIVKPEDVIVLTTVTVKDDLKAATTNLKAPIIINHTKKLGKQIVLDNKNYQIKQPLFTNSIKATVGQV